MDLLQRHLMQEAGEHNVLFELCELSVMLVFQPSSLIWQELCLQ